MIKTHTKTAKINNSNNRMSSASDISLAGSITQQLTSSSSLSSITSNNQKSSSSSNSTHTSNTTPKSSFRLSTASKLESDQILSSSSNYIIQAGGQVALAEAELDEIDDMMIETGSSSVPNIPIDDVEYMDNEMSSYSNTSASPQLQERTIQQPTENSTQVATDSKALSQSPVDPKSSHVLPSKINNIKMNLLNTNNNNANLCSSLFTSSTTTSNACSTVLLPEEKVSNEAKEYWATIDLYNNSKIAFNKRLKSVKLKREKINAEMSNRNQLKQTTCTRALDNPNHLSEQAEPCTCVKCSIVYHESLIKGIVSSSSTAPSAASVSVACSKCKLNNCKCCLASNSSSSSTNSDLSSNLDDKPRSKDFESTAKKSPGFKEEFDQFEEKLFNIKNELVIFD